MISKSEIIIHNTTYDCSAAVFYHLGAFPPENLDLQALINPLTNTAIALTRFDTLLRALPNSELLLAPLRARDAVVSSRMEGTISTLEEVLRLEAEAVESDGSPVGRNDTVEVALYARALRQAERQMTDGYPLSDHLIRTAHHTLLSYGRGAEKRPGEFKTEQNYIGDRRRKRIDFVPIAPEHLPPAMATLVQFIKADKVHPILRTALAHAEFEALHPFEDGNGRVGRMLITLMLWNTGVLSAPHFFVSDYFERNKDEYIERLRNVSANGDWTGWCIFFLAALQSQAAENIDIVGRIQTHYEQMRERLRDLLKSKWTGDVLNFIFANPIFRNNRFTHESGIPKPTANGFANRLVEAGILTVLVPSAGRAPGLYAFPSLLEIMQEPR
ncbi:MAG: Fic family protein [Pseudomonadota bacterium]